MFDILILNLKIQPFFVAKSMPHDDKFTSSAVFFKIMFLELFDLIFTQWA